MEMARIGWDPAKPLAVQQWQGLIAINYAARAYGITRHESPADALKKCPHLKLVHCLTYRHGDTEPGDHQDAKPETHKVRLQQSSSRADSSRIRSRRGRLKDCLCGVRSSELTRHTRTQISLDHYRRESLKIISIFREFCPVVRTSQRHALAMPQLDARS